MTNDFRNGNAWAVLVDRVRPMNDGLHESYGRVATLGNLGFWEQTHD